MSAAAVPAAPVPLRSWANRYASTCDTCGAPVARNAGTVRRAGRRDSAVRDAGRRWVVSCAGCDDRPVVHVRLPVVVAIARAAPAVVPAAPAVVPAAPVAAPDPGPAGVPIGYVLTTLGNVRCKGCGSKHGGGHHTGCNRLWHISRRRYSESSWIKGPVKPGSAAAAKLGASIALRLASIETDERGFITSMGKGC